MPGPLLVFCEQRDGRLKPASLEALGEAARLGETTGGPVVAVLIGGEAGKLAGEVAGRGAGRVLVAGHPSLMLYSAELYTGLLADAAQELNPQAILMAGTSMGRDLAPRLAARLESALLQDCIALELGEDRSILATRPVYGGKLREVAKARSQERQVITLRPHVFDEREQGPGADVPVEDLVFSETPDRPTATVREVQQRASATVGLSEASIVVAGGRGMKGPEHFKMLEELAALLDGAVGASRAVVDAGWMEHARQVGLTGKTIAPQLYFACGISGALQHQAGISSARIIVAINTDPAAPIFKLASYGIVGDLFDVVPQLIEEVRRLKAARAS